MAGFDVRRPALAGSFYPAQGAELGASVRSLLSAAAGRARARPPQALIVPHAGYSYSGVTAAAAYASLAPWAQGIRRVVLLGPAHRAAVAGIALPSVRAFATPLGEVRLAQGAIEALDALPQVSINDFPHQLEHSIEVQLPFLQTVLGDFELLPLLVGQASPAQVAEVLEQVWGGDETLIVVSSDLSHYLPSDAGRVADAITIRTLLKLDPTLDPEQACGAAPLNGLLLAARRHGLSAELLAQANSGPVSRRDDSVVGYAALVLRAAANDEAGPGHDERARTLTGLARQSIRSALQESAAPAPPAVPWLARRAASFVSLHQNSGELRGCVGGLTAVRPLGEDVVAHARAAALHDPRFAPLPLAELEVVKIEVSVLSPTEVIAVTNEDQLAAELRPAIDGLVIEAGTQRATFLPQVWQQLPAPREFIRQLKRKAGLQPDDWKLEWRFARYTVDRYQEA